MLLQGQLRDTTDAYTADARALGRPSVRGASERIQSQLRDATAKQTVASQQVAQLVPIKRARDVRTAGAR